MALPPEILKRVNRVLAYHQASKQTFDSFHTPTPAPDPARRPSPYRIFPDHPKTALPTTLMDAPADTLAVMEASLEALPDSWVAPPQDLKTLASWLYMAAGQTRQWRDGPTVRWLRTSPSSGGLYPYEIYVAAFGIGGLEPGFYHFNVREFSLRKLRDGPETLAQIKRGRPDLEFLKTAPAALLISTIFCRTTWQEGPRAYRSVLLDAGHLVQNLVTAGSSLGIQTITRLRMQDSTMRELIGLGTDATFGDAEAVQAMVVWADRATNPLAMPGRRPTGAWANADPLEGAADEAGFSPPPSNSSPDSPSEPAAGPAAGPVISPFASASPSTTANAFLDAGMFTARDFSASVVAPTFSSVSAAAAMPPIARLPLAAEVAAYGSILAVHQDCVAPGIVMRDVRPPLTEMSPLPPTLRGTTFPSPKESEAGASGRQVFLGRRTPRDFARTRVSREPFLRICRLAFRGGSQFPLFPAGPHVALIRPFWIVNAVSGMDDGIWYYHPPNDAWSLLRGGSFRREAQYLAREQEFCGNAAAVCFMTASLSALMTQAGPDIYRLALLEAGLIGQRLALAATALGLATAGVGAFYDHEVRLFLGLSQSSWELVYATAIGEAAGEGVKG